jgi:hypothetical protein
VDVTVSSGCRKSSSNNEFFLSRKSHTITLLIRIMAISGCTSILWRSKDLSFETIAYLIQIWFERRRTKLPSGSTRARPKVVIDANLVAYGHLSKKSPIMPDGAVEIIARAFSEKGIDVSIVCDHPTKRHPSKRATCERQGKRIKAGFKRIHASMELQSLLALPEESRDCNQINELQKTIRKCENAENRSLPEDFVENLSAFVEHYGSSEEGTLSLSRPLRKLIHALLRMLLTVLLTQ